MRGLRTRLGGASSANPARQAPYQAMLLWLTVALVVLGVVMVLLAGPWWWCGALMLVVAAVNAGMMVALRWRPEPPAADTVVGHEQSLAPSPPVAPTA